MNTIILNTIGTPCKAGGNSGGGGGNTPSKPKWTGHADAEGLRAIGWTDEDIAYYQENGVNWNEEDDEYHKVSDDNKALYGVLTIYNISTYAEKIVYLPKIDISGTTSMYGLFRDCYNLVGLPMLDTSKVTDMSSCFKECALLCCVPQFDTSNVTKMDYMFSGCYSLRYVPPLDISNVTSLSNTFQYCVSLEELVFVGTSKLANLDYCFYQCVSLKKIVGHIVHYRTKYTFNTVGNLLSVEKLDFQNNGTIDSQSFLGIYHLEHLIIDNLNCDLDLGSSISLSKESLLHIINNEAASSSRTIRVNKYVYNRLSNDADIVAALANHPNISISK